MRQLDRSELWYLLRLFAYISATTFDGNLTCCERIDPHSVSAYTDSKLTKVQDLTSADREQ